MKTERQSCCFCFNIALEGNIVDEDILELLKFLIVNVDTSALEHSTVCNDCLNKIIDSCEYKTKNSSKMLMGTKKETYPEKRVNCQKCKTVCEQGDSFPLVDCVTQIDWSDFVNYLFADQDSRSLKSSQICGCCRRSVSNIQQFLKLIYVYDQNRMKCDIDYCDDNTNKNLVKHEIKQELENYITDDKKEIENVIEDNKTDVGDSGYISYADFKCKNEEIDLKLEYDNQSTDRYEEVDVGEEVISSDGSNMYSSNKEDEQPEQGINSEEFDRLRYKMRVRKTISMFRSNYTSQEFDRKLPLGNHLLKNRGYETTNKDNLWNHKLKHVGRKKYKCQHCIYETYYKISLIQHIKIHSNIGDFKCTLCSKQFIEKRNLNSHLLKIHKCRDNITNKTHECDNCNFVTLSKTEMLQHNLKHGIIGDIQILKCHHCAYETYNKGCLISHVRVHNPVYKCILCSKNFAQRFNLDHHLLEVHENEDHITSKIYKCDKCRYRTIKKNCFLKHKLEHGKADLQTLKCHHCTYETFYQRILTRHLRIHNQKLKHENVAGLGKYKCKYCIYETYDMNTFIEHVKIHN